MMRDLPGGTVTFLFTDIEGSTRLLHELGAEAFSSALAEHRRVLRAAFARHGGVEVDTQGDAFFIAFADAAEAVAAGLEAQGALGPGPIRVRMGLHTGEPDLTEEGYVGRDVHLGARIVAAGHGGQVLMSASTREALANDADVTDLGEHRLKDFPGPIWIYQLGTDPFPPLKTISNSNLPRPVSSFIGREREVADIRGLLVDGARMLTLTGPGGTGKSRLAIESAAELVPSFRNGVFWVDLAPIRDPMLVTATIAQVIGVRAGLVEHIGERQMLLVLDNLEQIVEAASELAALLAACPNLRLLDTSRELLRVTGEVEYPVAPLPLEDAVELFVTRSGLATDETITALCRHLDNLPLAVELAAARTRVLSPAQILKLLSHRLDLLKGGRDADPRQQTLRATIQWSYDLLKPDEQALLARLSVFVGGWTIETAGTVCDADLDLLQSLVEKSLIRYASERFIMLETIREYAVERLDESYEADNLRRRHAEFFLDLARDIRAAAIGEPRAYDRLEPDYDNLRSALAWCVAHAERPRALAAVRSLWLYWLVRGHVAEGDRWAMQLLAVPGRADETEEAEALIVAGELARFAGDPRRAVELKVAALDQLRDADLNLYAHTARDLALVLCGLGEIDRAESFANEALEVQTTLGTADGLAHALYGVADVEWHRGRPGRAISLLEQSADKWAESGDESQRAASLEMLADFLRRSGDVGSARPRLQEAIRLAEHTGDQFTLLWCLRGFGSLLADEGDVGGAARVWGATEAGARESGLSFAEMPSDYDEKVAHVRARLGDAEFERLWSEGALMSREEAVHYVLG